ncbi:MAG: DUF4907 domain-containing protein [Crocinitomicaceae bacterium]|nr:DUF4907 domain-containing protein [Crocinitomicaceae bacterium]MDC0100028.1 DUF4907 domain-containing protein [Crocinitomicaceae bacterium]|tara:strand:+ start:6367 stop:6765 length:399 start_codon:yes stop_codon:yes gene_type:complete
MKYAFLIFIGVLMVSCGTENTDDLDVKLEKNSEQTSIPKYSSKVYYLQNVGWCYQVFRGTKMILNQKHIPAVQGIKGFETKEKAEIAVNFIMERVIAGNERPSVTPEELDSIGAIDLAPEVLPISDIPSEYN